MCIDHIVCFSAFEHIASGRWWGNGAIAFAIRSDSGSRLMRQSRHGTSGSWTTPQEKSPLEPDTKDGGRAPLSACRASRRQHARRQVRDGVAASSSRCPTGRCCQSLSTSRVTSARHGSRPSARRSLLIEAARSSISSSSSLWLAPSSAIGAVVVGACLAGPQAARRGCERMLSSVAGGCLEPAAALDGYAIVTSDAQ